MASVIMARMISRDWSMVTRVGFWVRDTAVTMLHTARRVISDDTNNIDMVVRDMDPGEVSRRLEITGTQATDIKTLQTPEQEEKIKKSLIREHKLPVKQMKWF